MFNRMTRKAFGSAQLLATQPRTWALVVRDAIHGLRITAHHTLMAAGLVSLAVIAMLFFNPHLADHIKTLSPFAAAEEEEIAEAPSTDTLAASAPASPASQQATEPNAQTVAKAETSVPATAAAPARKPSQVVSKLSVDTPQASTDPQQERVTAWLAKRYRVASDATHMLVSAAYSTAHEIKLDPLLILAVVAIESRFNPFAESPVGAQGLMQVMSKVHRDKFRDHGGVKAALNPVANIKVGSRILKEYVRRGGSVEAGLKLYVGAAAMESDSGYGSKVLAEYRRLQDVANGKTVPVTTTAARAGKPAERQALEKAEPLVEAELTHNQPV